MSITLLVLLGIAAVVGWALAIFLGTEFLKKFRFMQRFIGGSNMLLSYRYYGCKEEGHASGMRNIVLRGRGRFAVLVGFKLYIPVLGYTGFDYYGVVESREPGVAVISTYCGRGVVDFLFFLNTDLDSNRIAVSSTNADQQLAPGAVYPPHWYQTLGFYG